MKRILESTEYSFDASAQTVTLNIYNPDIRRVHAIINRTDNTTIFQAIGTGLGYTSFTGGIITLAFDTTAMADTDILEVIYEDVTQPISSDRGTFFDQFATYDTTNTWETVQTGSGQTISSPAVTANGASYLNVATGTTTNAETIIMSRQIFKFPIEVIFGVSISQRIANQEFYCEMVEVDSDGAVVTSGTSTDFNNAKNGISIKFDGTNVSQNKFNVRCDGLSPFLDIARLCTQTTATGTTPNFINAGQYQLTCLSDQIAVTSKASPASTTIQNYGSVTMKDDYIPNPTKLYKIRIRIKNLSSAPASTTDFRLHYVRAIEINRVTLDPTLFPAQGTQGTGALPVTIQGSGSTLTIGTVTANVGPVTSLGGSTHYHLISANTTNAVSVKASVGVINSIVVSNTNASPRYLKIYNKASAPTVGTDTPVKTILVPANQTIVVTPGNGGDRLQTGIAIATTTGIAVADTGAVGTSDLAISITYT